MSAYRVLVTGSRDTTEWQAAHGRRMLRANIALCAKCQNADARDARLRRMHSIYGRRTRR